MEHFLRGFLLEITISNNFGSVHQKTAYFPYNYVFTNLIRENYCPLLLKANSKHDLKRKTPRAWKQIPREHRVGGTGCSVTFSSLLWGNVLSLCRATNFPN